MSKPVECLVVNGPNDVECPRPYKVKMHQNGFYTVMYAGDEDAMLFEMSVDTLEVLLNDAYEQGVKDAVETVVKKALDHVLGVC